MATIQVGPNGERKAPSSTASNCPDSRNISGSDGQFLQSTAGRREEQWHK